jgi:uncharacterized membrane protein HdeD (DUF308 family)
MSDHVTPSEDRVTPPHQFGPGRSGLGLRETLHEGTGYWWLFLVAGIAWIVISLVILQFDGASVATVGILVGLMFLLAAAQNFLLTALPGTVRWISAIFGVLFVVAAVICFIHPKGTFAAMADILGFLFLLIGVWWMVRAFLERPVNPLWWLGLIAGILMTAMAFWVSGQFFIHKAYVLLVFAGIWAMMQGIVDIVRAFQIRRLHEQLEGGIGELAAPDLERKGADEEHQGGERGSRRGGGGSQRDVRS